MKPTDQARADAAIDSYFNRSLSDIDSPKHIPLEGTDYTVFGYANDPITGFHATAYRSVEVPHRIIIAYRGTDTDLFTGETKAEKAGHALTTLQDIAVDATMVRDAVNPQKAAADAFTAQMLAKAAARGIPKDHVTVAGHSLGGALAQIEAAKYGLAGSTYNAYGARGLTDGTPQPGCQVTNYRMANDLVSAASPHVGSMVSLASHDDVQSLRAGRYLDAPVGAPPPNVLIATRWGDHGAAQHFGSQSPDNVLAPQRFSEASQRYTDHQSAFEHFTWEVAHERAELSQALRQLRAHPDQTHLPADIQRQVNEYLALNWDSSLRDAIEHNAHVQSAARSLHDTGDAARTLGHAVHDMDERMASDAQRAGVAGLALSPMAPLVGQAASLAAHLHGRAADGLGHFVGDQFESAKHAVEQSAHYVADAAQRVIHDPDVQAAGANVVNQAVDLYHGAQAAAHSSAGQAAGQTYDGIKYIVSPGIDVVEHAAGQAYDTLTHPGQLFQHSVPAASIPPTATNADTSSSSSSSSAAASTPPPAMDRHTGLQEDHAIQQRQEHIQQAQQQAAHLAQAHRQTQPPPAHSAPVHEKPASVDMQEQARIAQLQQQEQQAQAAREQQHRLAQQHAQLHRQTMDAQQREHEQRHSQDTRSHQHEQRQAGEAMLYTPPTRTPRSDEHLQDFRHPDHPLHPRYTLFKDALAQSHDVPRNGDKLPYGPEQQERLAAAFTNTLGIDKNFEHSIKGFKQHEGQLLAYENPFSVYEKSKVLRIDPQQALAQSPEQHAATWRAREATHAPAPPSRAIAPVAITPEDMRHPAHPSHALFEQARDAIADAHERWGRPVPDAEQLDRHAAQVVVETRKFGHTEVDKIYLGLPQGHTTQTPNYLAKSHGQLWAQVNAPQLTQAPDVAQASQQLQSVEQQRLAEQAMQAQRAAQMQGQGMVMKL
ncbi:XVIPCD domain-containing protein [Xanthomonas albilineans]|uniref:XVIPCD domain-containing protein n=1 Tax=Xanthomonas albilineans TaxID=29447 RepID=UPI000B2BC5BF|nr:XVIPCD domain-containing protein [Xanthomonas albilineans]